MSDFQATFDQQFLEMRWRALSLAADFDRLYRLGGNPSSDVRLSQLRDALRIAMSPEPDRAERVQMLFSDMTPPPGK